MNELTELRNKLQAWLDSLNQRERRLVIGAAIFLSVFLLYQLTWAPFVNGVANMQAKVNQQQQDLLWMQQAAREVSGLRGASAGQQPVHSGSLLGLIEKTARERGLGTSIRKVQPEGQNGVRMWMDKVPFDDVMTWLDDLQLKQGVTVSSFSAERTAQAGWVNVRLLVEAQ